MENKTANICACVDPELKKEVESIFAGLGLSPEEAINMFYDQVSRFHGLPFAVKLPNKEMREAMRQAETGEGLVEYESLDDMEAEWNDDEQGRSR